MIEIAQEYVKEQICPLLPNASISDYAPVMPVNPIQKLRGIVNKLNNIHAKQEYLWSRKQRDSSQSTESLDQFKTSITIHRLLQSDIDALEKADAEQGFYVVWVNVKYDNEKYESFDIVVSRDLEVLNSPIDISEINKTVEQMRDVYDL